MALVPPELLTDWTPNVYTGVIGGIPSRNTILNVTDPPYNADPTGVGDSTSAFQDATTDACTANNGTVVYAPTGNYLISGSIVNNLGGINRGSNFSIRGDGPGLTNIIYDNATPSQRMFAMGTGSSWNFPTEDNIVLTGNSKDSTSITIADASPFSVGMLMRIQWANMVDDTEIEAGKVPVIHTYGFGFVRNQTVRVTGVNTTTDTITFFPPIYHDPDGLEAVVFLSTFASSGIGIESMTITGADTNPFSLIEFNDCHDCWVTDVDVKRANNYNIYFAACVNMEVRRCTISERTSGGTNGAGNLANNCSGILVEDNIFFDLAPCLEWNFGTSGSVFAYNFVDGIVNINHGPHNSFNLYEGNIFPFIQSDGYFGGSSECLIYRNWDTGVFYEADQFAIISLNRFSRKYSMIGNIFGNEDWPFGNDPYTLGYPNLGNSSFTGEAQPTEGDFWNDWKATGTLTTRDSDTAGTVTLDSPATNETDRFASFIYWTAGGDGNTILENVVSSTPQIFDFTSVGVLPAALTPLIYWPGPSGFQELDLDVEASSFFKGNRIISSTANELIPGESLGGDTLIDSFFRSSKPDYFGDLAWPPIDPTNASTANYEANPAGYRFINGDDPPAEPGGITTFGGSGSSVFSGSGSVTFPIT